MNEQSSTHVTTLYHEDETAWLEMMAQFIEEGRIAELDHEHLSEFLFDMARRDRREVLSRLTVLLTHLLKWEHQPDNRNASWEATIWHQRQELADLLESRTLWNHALDVLSKAYARAVKQAALETSLPETAFPPDCSMPLEQVLGFEEQQATSE